MAKQTVTFHSLYANHVLTRIAKDWKPLDANRWVTTEPGIKYTFQPAPNPNPHLGEYESNLIGVLVATEGKDRMVDGSGWLAPDQEQGVERDMVDALKAHRDYGYTFWIQGHEPGTLYPRPIEFRADVRKASVTLDEETLVAMINKERATHQRQELIAEAQDALDLVRSALAEVAAAQAEKAPKPKPKAPAAA